MPAPPFYRVTVLTFAILVFSLLAAGCTLSSAKAGGALSIPPSGRVRLVARRIEQTSDRVHWKWSVIGERNWTTPRADGSRLSLEKTYPLNDNTVRGGCNIYEADLIAQRGKGKTSADSAAGQWTLLLHGSDGDTARSEGTLPSGLTDNAVQITQDSDALLRLPARVRLATVGGQEVTLDIPR